MRVAKAQDELFKLGENHETEEEIEKFKISLKLKYDIPDGVHLFGNYSDDEGYYRIFLNQTKKHIISFVKGELDDLSFSDLYFFFEEIAECDYPWVLIEKPTGFYGSEGYKCIIEDLLPELKSIGCRSKKKNKRLPKICGIFSAK